METTQNSINPIESTNTLTPEMCRAVLAELETLHSELNPSERDVFGRHAECNGYSLVAAQVVRTALENGLSRNQLVDWMARWADKAEDAADSFDERRATAEIRGYVASLTRFSVGDMDGSDSTERLDLETRVCSLAQELDCVAVSAWALVFELAVFMIVYEDRGDQEDIPVLGGEILSRFMYEVCSEDEKRAAMLDDLRAFIERERAQQTPAITSAAGWRLGSAPAVANQNGPTARDLLLAAKSLDASCNCSELYLSPSESARVVRIAHELFERAAAAATHGGPDGELTQAEQLELACERAMIRWPESLRAQKSPLERAAGIAGAQGDDACAAARKGDWAGAVRQLEHCVALEREHGGPDAWAPVLTLCRQLAAQVPAAAGA